MKNLLTILLCGLLLFGCSDKYDDSGLRNDLNDLEKRVAKLEELCKQMNTNISSLQKIVDAFEGHLSISQVEQITDGYIIHFSDGSTATIKNGMNSGDAPVIGVRQDADGMYYWTLNGNWLTDEKGNKVKAQATDGKDGADGEDGTNGTDGKDGADGTNGKDGITPQLKIENGRWMLSTDNGETWTDMGQATGADGTDGKDGVDGKDGANGIFKNVTEDDDNVYFTLEDDSVITIPKSVTLSIRFDSSDLINISAGETKTLNYTIISTAETVTIETFEQAGWKVEITEQTALTGTIAITAPNPIRDGKILIILTDAQNNSYMKTITLKGVGNIITVVQDSYTVKAAGGLLDVPISANIDYTIQIPQEAETWLSVQSHGDNIRFSIAENESYDGRSADVTLAGADGTTSCKVTIAQLQKDAIILSESDYELTYDQQTLQVVLQSNADLLVTIPETDTWITHISTRAMTERTLNFNIASNDGTQSRTGHITIQNTDKDVSQTITIVQNGDIADVLAFEDPLFKAYLTANFDTNNDNEIDTKEALNITSIKCNGKSIYSLKGIEYFANLKTLDCSNNSVVELDLTQNTQLTEVKCFSNSLVDLKIGGLEKLSYLDCNTNSLTTIDTSTNPALTYYNCASNVIKSLDVSNNTKLEKLYCYSCQLLASLNVKNCGHLTGLYLSNYSNCVSESTISVKNSSLQSLVLGGYAKWTNANISDNAYLKAVDLSELPTLITLNCKNNAQLSSLNTDKCYAIKYIDCSSNILSALDLSTNRALQTLNCSLNRFSVLDLRNNASLLSLDCSVNGLTSLNITSCVSLEQLFCQSNNLQDIAIENNLELKTLNCAQNALTALDISKNTKMLSLICDNNYLTELKLSSNTELNSLSCAYNSIVALDLSANILLESIMCRNNVDLSSVQLPNTIKTIQKSAFQDCQSLTAITIPESVTTLEGNAFTNCVTLKELTCLANIVKSGFYKNFSYCPITTIEYGEKVTIIDDKAYFDSLQTIIIPATNRSIGDRAFYYCENIQSIYCAALTPPIISYDPFNISSAARFYVPMESVDTYKYKADPGWRIYASQIVGYNFTE